MCKRFILVKLEAAAVELQRSVWDVEVSICCQPWIRRASTQCHEEGLTCLSVIENIYFAKSSTEWRTTYLRELAIAREDSREGGCYEGLACLFFFFFRKSECRLRSDTRHC